MYYLVRAVVLLSVCVAGSTTLPSAGAQTAATSRVMREKMHHAQQVLHALMVSNHQALATHSNELMVLTRDPGWQVLTSPEYLRQSSAFVQTLEDLRQSAGARDLDGAIIAYNAMTLRCYQCHRYLKGMRIAAAPGRGHARAREQGTTSG